jgi:hypothetical protein
MIDISALNMWSNEEKWRNSAIMVTAIFYKDAKCQGALLDKNQKDQIKSRNE